MDYGTTVPARMTASQSQQKRLSRPWSVTMLAIGVLIFSGFHLLRFMWALELWDFLIGLLPIHPLYLALSGLVWSLIGLIMTWGLWRGHRWAPLTTFLAVLAYSMYYWLDRLILSPSGGGSNLPFAIAANLVLLIVVGWILYRRKSKAYFGEMNDRKS